MSTKGSLASEVAGIGTFHPWWERYDSPVTRDAGAIRRRLPVAEDLTSVKPLPGGAERYEKWSGHRQGLPWTESVRGIDRR